MEQRFSEQKRKNVRILSKIMYIFAVILQYICVIASGAVLLGIIVLPVLSKNIKFKENKFIIFNQELKYETSEDDTQILFSYEDSSLAYTMPNGESAQKFTELFTKQNYNKFLVYLGIEMLGSLAMLVIVFLALRYAKKILKGLFENLAIFNQQNSLLLEKISKVIIIYVLLEAILTLVLSLLLDFNVYMHINFMGIAGAILLYLLSYIFDYGYSLQECSKTEKSI